jgi:hypothetical protein
MSLDDANAEIDRLREVVKEYKRKSAELVERIYQLDQQNAALKTLLVDFWKKA